MQPKDQPLWQKLEAFGFDQPDVAFSFSDRLARENGWSKHYARRVVEEYRKFLLMCCLTETGVTPSDAVDQAWHLHLTYTRSYWHDLCRDTLGREIHHNPTKGGQSEVRKFNGFYTNTHRLYRVTFGTEPPADIWPANDTRFSDIDFRRVNLRRNWVLPQPTRWAVHIAALTGLLVSALLFVQASSGVFVAILMGVVGFGGLIWLINNFSHNRSDPQPKSQATDDGGSSPLLYNSDSSDHHDGTHHIGDGNDSADADSGCSNSGCSGCGGGD